MQERFVSAGITMAKRGQVVAALLGFSFLVAAVVLALTGNPVLGGVIGPAGTHKAVTAGSHHTCAIATDDTITCWGGLPERAHALSGSPDGTYKAVTAGVNHSCAVATDDTITCWGDATWGETAAPAGRYMTLSSGAFHSCAIATDGAVTCWGSRSTREVGAADGTYTVVTAGAFHSCAIAIDGAVTCWGPVPTPAGVRW
ncbi:MAG: hypothetical protein OXC00_14825, partial [Acidimicrobiaceae bacterium]|nr:hypothetical protein [Acidimicrobiaceae bacterium]